MRVWGVTSSELLINSFIASIALIVTRVCERASFPHCWPVVMGTGVSTKSKHVITRLLCSLSSLLQEVSAPIPSPPQETFTLVLFQTCFWLSFLFFVFISYGPSSSSSSSSSFTAWRRCWHSARHVRPWRTGGNKAENSSNLEESSPFSAAAAPSSYPAPQIKRRKSIEKHTGR